MIAFRFDDRKIRAPRGMSVAAALIASGVYDLRQAPNDGAPRGAFCMMGVCQECLVLCDGMTIEACRLPVAQGLEVRSIRRQ